MDRACSYRSLGIENIDDENICSEAEVRLSDTWL